VRQANSAQRDFANRACHGSAARSHLRSGVVTAGLALVAVTCTTTMAPADENGVTFWVPGFFGSLAATPQQPGWSLASIYYHTDVSRERQYSRVPRNHDRTIQSQARC
jgi:hypothetical protein